MHFDWSFTENVFFLDPRIQIHRMYLLLVMVFKHYPITKTTHGSAILIKSQQVEEKGKKKVKIVILKFLMGLHCFRFYHDGSDYLQKSSLFAVSRNQNCSHCSNVECDVHVFTRLLLQSQKTFHVNMYRQTNGKLV